MKEKLAELKKRLGIVEQAKDAKPEEDKPSSGSSSGERWITIKTGGGGGGKPDKPGKPGKPDKPSGGEDGKGYIRVKIDGQGRVVGGSLPREQQGKPIGQAFQSLERQSQNQPQGQNAPAQPTERDLEDKIRRYQQRNFPNATESDINSVTNVLMRSARMGHWGHRDDRINELASRVFGNVQAQQPDNTAQQPSAQPTEQAAPRRRGRPPGSRNRNPRTPTTSAPQATATQQQDPLHNFYENLRRTYQYEMGYTTGSPEDRENTDRFMNNVRSSPNALQDVANNHSSREVREAAESVLNEQKRLNLQPTQQQTGQTRSIKKLASTTRIRSSESEAQLKRETNRMFGKELSFREVVETCGGFNELAKEYYVSVENGQINIYAQTNSNTKLSAFSRYITEDYMKMSLFTLNDHAKGQNIAPQMLYTALVQAQKLGIKKIKTYAAGSYADPTFNGYYTWARCGYEQELEPWHYRKLNKAVREGMCTQEEWDNKFSKYTHVSQYMETAQGREIWKKLGQGLDHAEFDTDPNSKCVRVLKRYLQGCGIKI